MSNYIAITGARRGIGKAIAMHLQEKLNNIDYDGIICVDKKWLDEDKKGFGDKFKFEDLDISESINKDVIKLINKKHDISISALINNASLKSIKGTDLNDTTKFLEILKIDLISTYFLSKQFLDSHKESKNRMREPKLISISSCVARNPSNDLMAYHMAKAALEVMCKKFLIDYSEIGLRSNCIAPGFIVKEEDLLRFEHVDNELYRNIAEKIHPNGKVGSAKDIAGVVEFLLSKESNFINGQVLNVDGGYNLEDDFSIVRRILNG
jgi:3-oxoacyl-[acyl-carrier protein] reductase